MAYDVTDYEVQGIMPYYLARVHCPTREAAEAMVESMTAEGRTYERVEVVEVRRRVLSIWKNTQ